ncbi:hypothetical protein MHYP_G00164960 [Metynnis hypsauchen]
MGKKSPGSKRPTEARPGVKLASEGEVAGLSVDSGAFCASANQQSACAAGEQRELPDRFHAVSRAALLGWRRAAGREEGKT